MDLNHMELSRKDDRTFQVVGLLVGRKVDGVQQQPTWTFQVWEGDALRSRPSMGDFPSCEAAMDEGLRYAKGIDR